MFPELSYSGEPGSRVGLLRVEENHLKFEKDSVERGFSIAGFEDEGDHVSRNVGASMS